MNIQFTYDGSDAFFGCAAQLGDEMLYFGGVGPFSKQVEDRDGQTRTRTWANSETSDTGSDSDKGSGMTSDTRVRLSDGSIISGTRPGKCSNEL